MTCRVTARDRTKNFAFLAPSPVSIVFKTTKMGVRVSEVTLRVERALRPLVCPVLRGHWAVADNASGKTQQA